MIEPVDTILSVGTPEGLTFRLRPAGPYARGVAFLLDTVIQLSLFVTIIFITSLLRGNLDWFFLILFFVTQWFYFACFEAFNQGRTPGKMAVLLEAVREDGAPLDRPSALLRNLVRSADVLFFAFGIGLVVMMFSRKFQRLGDLAAGTIVVYRPKRPRKRESGAIAPSSAPLEPPRILDAEESVAVLSFAQRLDTFAPARAAELARHALSALHGTDEVWADPIERMKSYAAWIAGARP